MEDDFEPQKESKFNSAVQQIIRLSRLWDLAHESAQKCNWNTYEIILNRIWVELASDTPKEILEERKKLVAEINRIQSIPTGYNQSMNLWEYPEIEKKVYRKNALLKEALENYEIFLRTNQNTQGLGKSYRNESDEDIE